MHDDTLGDDNREKFLAIAKRYGQIIEFYNVEKICAEEIKYIKKLFKNYPTLERFTIGVVCRIFSPKIFPCDVEKIIYLDAGIFCGGTKC